MVVAIFALSAALAAAAQAQEFHSDAETGKTTTLSGEQVTQPVIKTNSGTIKCNSAAFSGSMVGASAAMIALAPSYKECTFAGQKATLDIQKIFYTYTWTIFVLWYHMVLSVESEPIKISTLGGCVITIGEQTVDHIKFENKEVAGIKHILGTYEISKLKYTANEKCPKPGTFEDGTYTGTQTIKGTNEAGKATSVWVE